MSNPRIAAMLAALSAVSSLVGQPSRAPSAVEIRAIAEEAYIFAYPMVLMEFTRRSALERLGPMQTDTNHFANSLQFPPAQFRQVIRPNADTLYSSGWLDLSREPVLLHVPDTQGRYYLMQLMDAWTETVSVPGKRTTGTAEQWFAIVGPGWKGKLPASATRIDCPTNMAWLLGRTQTNGVADYENVHAIQKKYVLLPLSRYPDGPSPPSPNHVENHTPFVPPPQQVHSLSAVEFFQTFAQLLGDNPPHADDGPMMRRLLRIGIAPGKVFDAAALGADGSKALENGAADAVAKLSAANWERGAESRNGWSGGGKYVGRYGANYFARAVVARVGLGANPPEDATYWNCSRDSGGQPLDGTNTYRIHFDKGHTPPVKAFWSVTVYSEQGYFTENPIHRYAIGDRDNLKVNSDGSLDILLQHESPGRGDESNWLPSPSEKFNLSLRMYWPSDDILNGHWMAPPVKRAR